ncbi:Sodium- and chloride-dependent glycine transporter 2, partial [Frankliniella fusca]
QRRDRVFSPRTRTDAAQSSDEERCYDFRRGRGVERGGKAAVWSGPRPERETPQQTRHATTWHAAQACPPRPAQLQGDSEHRVVRALRFFRGRHPKRLRSRVGCLTPRRGGSSRPQICDR